MDNADKKPYVYFFGNSITTNSDIPGRFHQMVMAGGGYPSEYFGYRQITAGGARIANFFLNHNPSGPASLLFTQPRFIVLQEQSAGPEYWSTIDIVRAIFTIANISQSELILYQTWHTPDKYRALAQEVDIAMAPISEVWTALQNNDSALTFDSLSYDGTHATVLGATINAAVFYYTIFPERNMLPNILSQSGLSITQEKEQAYNQVIFNTVRAETLASHKGVKHFVADNVSPYQQITTIQVEGEDVTLDLQSYDIDIYELPILASGYRWKIYSLYSYYDFYTSLTPFLLYTVTDTTILHYDEVTFQNIGGKSSIHITPNPNGTYILLYSAISPITDEYATNTVLRFSPEQM